MFNQIYIESEGKKLQAANEAINDPKCTVADCEANASSLKAAAATLRKNQALQKVLTGSIKDATRDFRKWEQVGDVYVTMEPFAMVNGQLTQSYKVKRASVIERYCNELPK